eukprot:g5238.t1
MEEPLMGMGRRQQDRQQEFWVATDALASVPKHIFYDKLNSLLDEAGFDQFVENLCQPFYSNIGRGSIPPGRYFRMLFVGYFEEIDSQRGIAWRCADSLSLRNFLFLNAADESPEHSSLTRIRKRLPLWVHERVFTFVLEIAHKKKLLVGKQVGVDATTLEANAAMKSIVRRDSGEDWKDYLRGLAEEAGVEINDDEDLRRFDKQRSKEGKKKVSNEEWVSSSDPESRIIKMKDRRTQLGYKAEHVVDLESEYVLSAAVYEGTAHDTATLIPSIVAAQTSLIRAGSDAEIQEAGAHQHEESGADKWTCSMHPQIQKDGPGDCPICGMDLIPLKSGKAMGLRYLSVTPEARALMNLETAPVERRYVEAEIRMVGKVEYDETRLKYITAWVSGRLDRMFVDYTGVPVKKGDHMVNIYSEELYSAQQELIEAVRTAPKTAQERVILRQGGVDLLESVRTKLRLLGLDKNQIAEIEARKTPSDHVLINAQMGGIVVEKLRKQGDRVRTGDRIYGIADLTQLWVKMDAYEADLAWIRYGQTVEITTEAYPGMKPLIGRVAFIDPVLDKKTRTVKVRVNIDNKKGLLKPEMFVHAVVRAKVAGEGRVIDPGLAGKWISPMHPEVVKNQPGKCDVCGMPLVRAESLGYVVAGDRVRFAPLVIPVSAALITGSRAVVYVELPNFPREILDKYQHVTDAMNGDDLAKIQEAFSDLKGCNRTSALPTQHFVVVWE